MKFKAFFQISVIVFLSLVIFNFSLLPISNNQAQSVALADGLYDLIKEQLEQTGGTAEIHVARAGKWETPFYFVGVIVWLFVGFVGFLFFAQLILGALHWILSGGNEEKIKKAQSRIYNAAIGIAVFLGAYFLTNFMFNYFSKYLAFELW